VASDAKPVKLQDVQGDIWSKGFPKDNETYYLFQINPQRAKDFARSLKNLVNTQPGLISSVAKVKEDWKSIHRVTKPKTVDVANALIAFTYAGLSVVST